MRDSPRCGTASQEIQGGFLDTILNTVALLVGLLIGITVHECAHAWTANQLGDPTARYLGRISLNPIVHLDPVGTLLMLFSLLSGFGIGWGKPTPVNPVYLKYGPRTGMALVAVAGPISNITVAVLFAIPWRLADLGLPLPGELATLIFFVVSANISLCIFNLLPIPPLDGFSVLVGILSQIRGRWSYQVIQWLRVVEAQGPLVLIAILAMSYVLPGPGILGRLMLPPYLMLRRLILGI